MIYGLLTLGAASVVFGLAQRIELLDAARFVQGGAGLSNVAWALGQVVGGVAGGTLAGLGGHAAPTLASAALLVLTVAYSFRALPAPR